jgi:hypothetical protein
LVVLALAVTAAAIVPRATAPGATEIVAPQGVPAFSIPMIAKRAVRVEKTAEDDATAVSSTVGLVSPMMTRVDAVRAGA